MKANIKDRKLQEFIQESRVIAENSISTDEMKEYINDLCDELEKCTNLRKFLKDANRGAEINFNMAKEMIQWVGDLEEKTCELLKLVAPYRFKGIKPRELESRWKTSDI